MLAFWFCILLWAIYHLPSLIHLPHSLLRVFAPAFLHFVCIVLHTGTSITCLSTFSMFWLKCLLLNEAALITLIKITYAILHSLCLFPTLYVSSWSLLITSWKLPLQSCTENEIKCIQRPCRLFKCSQWYLDPAVFPVTLFHTLCPSVQQNNLLSPKLATLFHSFMTFHTRLFPLCGMPFLPHFSAWENYFSLLRYHSMDPLLRHGSQVPRLWVLPISAPLTPHTYFIFSLIIL